MAGNSTLVKELREKTGAGIMDCQNALKENENDIEKAIEHLRKKGLATAQKKAGRETNEGTISAYIHPGSRIGVLVEVNCETDFVARNEEFQAFVKDIALQIAASKPSYVKREDIPGAVIEKEKGIYHSDYYLFSNLLLYITNTRCLYQSTAHRSLGVDYGCMDFCWPAVFTRLDLRIYLC